MAPVEPVEPVRRGPGPLSGVRVLDFSRVLSGPHCGRMLADMGADVIKVEPPEGDMTRYSFPRVNSIATYFTQQNCGKRNISLDLRQPRAVELLRELARRSHVVLENFRPGVMDRMGLGYEALAAEHPDLVYASLTGYGSTGPWAHRRAYAPVVGAESGLTWLQGEARGGSYANDPISHGDVYPALECLAGILAALYQRERTGRGQHVEVSMTATLLSINEHVHWELADTPADGFVASFQPGDYPVFTVGDGQTRRRLRPPGRAGHLRALRPRRRPPRAHRRRALRRRRVPAAATGRAPRRAPGRREDVPVAGRARGRRWPRRAWPWACCGRSARWPTASGPASAAPSSTCPTAGAAACASPTRPGTSARPTSGSGASRPTGASTTARCSAPSAS